MLAQYQSGSLSPDEMARIDALAKEDELLADALEGLKELANPNELPAITTALLSDVESLIPKATPFQTASAFSTRPILRYAAAAVVVLFMGWTVVEMVKSMSPNSTTETMAEAAKEDFSGSEEVEAPGFADNTTPEIEGVEDEKLPNEELMPIPPPPVEVIEEESEVEDVRTQEQSDGFLEEELTPLIPTVVPPPSPIPDTPAPEEVRDSKHSFSIDELVNRMITKADSIEAALRQTIEAERTKPSEKEFIAQGYTAPVPAVTSEEFDDEFTNEKSEDSDLSDDMSFGDLAEVEEEPYKELETLQVQEEKNERPTKDKASSGPKKGKSSSKPKPSTNSGTTVPSKAPTNDSFPKVEYTAPDVDQIREWFAQGIIYYKQKKFNSAINKFNQVLEKEPNNAEVLYYTANSYLSLKNTKLAIPLLEKLVNQGKSGRFYESSKWYLASAYLMRKNKKKARELLKDIVAEGGKYKSDAKKILADLE